jgi:hypothetical protein
MYHSIKNLACKYVLASFNLENWNTNVLGFFKIKSTSHLTFKKIYSSFKIIYGPFDLKKIYGPFDF